MAMYLHISGDTLGQCRDCTGTTDLITLMENIDKEDSLFLDELLDEAKHAESAACSRSFQYGLAAGLVLMQEAQALVREQSVTEVSIKTK